MFPKRKLQLEVVQCLLARVPVLKSSQLSLSVKATPKVSPPKEVIAKVSESFVAEKPLPVQEVLEVFTNSELQHPLPDNSEPVLEIGNPVEEKSDSYNLSLFQIVMLICLVL